MYVIVAIGEVYTSCDEYKLKMNEIMISSKNL